MYVAAGSDFVVPVDVGITCWRLAVRDDVQQTALPSVTVLISSKSIEYGEISGFLQVEIQRGINPQALLVNFFTAILFFQVLPHLFYEIRRDTIRFALHIELNRRVLGALGFFGGDLAIFEHIVDDEIAAAQRPV